MAARRSSTVMRCDVRDDLFVLVEDHCQPVAVLQREMAHPVELRFHRGNQLPDLRMPGDLQDHPMHRLIEREEAHLVADIDAALLLRESGVAATRSWGSSRARRHGRRRGIPALRG